MAHANPGQHACQPPNSTIFSDRPIPPGDTGHPHLAPSRDRGTPHVTIFVTCRAPHTPPPRGDKKCQSRVTIFVSPPPPSRLGQKLTHPIYPAAYIGPRAHECLSRLPAPLPPLTSRLPRPRPDNGHYVNRAGPAISTEGKGVTGAGPALVPTDRASSPGYARGRAGIRERGGGAGHGLGPRGPARPVPPVPAQGRESRARARGAPSATG